MAGPLADHNVESNLVNRSICVVPGPFLNTNNLKNLYYSLFYSHLVYAIQVWGSDCASEINKIQAYKGYDMY